MIALKTILSLFLYLAQNQIKNFKLFSQFFLYRKRLQELFLFLFKSAFPGAGTLFERARVQFLQLFSNSLPGFSEGKELPIAQRGSDPGGNELYRPLGSCFVAVISNYR